MSRGSCRSAADMAVAHCLALCEFLILYHNVCCINLISFPVCITSGLDTACHNNADSLTEIFFCELCLSSESHAADKISRSLSVPFKTTVNSQSISGDCH